MKLSEAIREGSRRWPETRRVYIDDNGCCCALGAAAQMVGLCASDVIDPIRTDLGQGFARAFPIALRLAIHPLWIPSKVQIPLWQVINCLHAAGGWSRQAIAEWVETIERQAEEEQPALEEVLREYPKALIEAEGGYVPEAAP
jgi:hypothetical protein